MDLLVSIFNGSNDDNACMLLYGDMCKAAAHSKPNIDQLLFKNDLGSVTMGIAAIKHCIVTQECPPVCTKDRFRRLVEIASLKSSVVSTAAMDVLHNLLIANRLDDFEKKQLYSIALGIAANRCIQGYMVRYAWATSIVLECASVYRECFVGGIVGAFVGNCSVQGICDPNIRGLKVFIETAVVNNGVISKKQYYDQLDNMVFLLGYPSDLLVSSFVGFSHVKHTGKLGPVVDSVSRSPSTAQHVLASAIRYAIKTTDMLFDAYTFIETIAQDSPIETYLDLKTLYDDVVSEENDALFVQRYKQCMQPLAVALYAFCRSPDSFGGCIEQCSGKLAGSALSTATTIAGMLCGCRTGNVPRRPVVWNGQDVYLHVLKIAEKMFELANTHRITIA